MTDTTCSVADCSKPPKNAVQAYCSMHYSRLRRHGSLDYPERRAAPGVKPRAPEVRFWERVDKSGPGGCWLWTGRLSRDGYGRIVGHGVYPNGDPMPVMCHRFAYELLVGLIPEGMELDHQCRVRNCVNPDHLRPVTSKQNSENRDGPAATNKYSGVRGVQRMLQHGRPMWGVRVGHNGARVFGGLFPLEDLAGAEAAAIALRNRLHTHNDRDRVG